MALLNQSLPASPTKADAWLRTGLPSFVSAIAIAIGLLIRWLLLGKNSLWFDEGYTAWAVSNPLAGIVRVIKVDTAPPLYYLLLRGWCDMFGHGEAGLRSMSALMASIGLLVFVAIVYRMVKLPWARTVAICLFSLSFMQVAYAHEARFYAMMSMLGAIDLYLVLLLCDRATVPLLLLTSSAWTASLYTNNMMAVYLACLSISWLLLPGKRSLISRGRDITIVAGISGLAFVPWLPTLLAQTHRIDGAFWPSVPDRWALARTICIFLGVHDQALPRGDRTLFAWIEIGVVVLAIAGCHSWPQRRKLIAMTSFAVLPILLIFSYSQVSQPIFVERVFLPSGIAMPLLVALALQGIRLIPVRMFAVAFVVWLIALSATSLPTQWRGEHAEQWREASRYLTSTSVQNRLVICVAPEAEPLYDYYARHGNYTPIANLTGTPRQFFLP